MPDSNGAFKKRTPPGLMNDAEIAAQDAEVRPGKVVATTVIYKSDPKDAKIIALQEEKIKVLEEKLHDRTAGLRSAPAADTPLGGGIQASRK